MGGLEADHRRPLTRAGTADMNDWPKDSGPLARRQDELAAAAPAPWRPADGRLVVAGCWVCFPRGLTGSGGSGDPAWAASVAMRGNTVVDHCLVTGVAAAAYRPGMLALRLGALMEAASRGLTTRPDVLLLDATGRDHPRRAGLALHLGAVLGVPTVGITHRPLLARGAWPAEHRGATSPLRIGDEVVACWMRTREGARPLVVHPGWRTDLDTAVTIVASTTGRRRTPEPLRRARELARRARAGWSAPASRAREQRSTGGDASGGGP